MYFNFVVSQARKFLADFQTGFPEDTNKSRLEKSYYTNFDLFFH